MRTPEVPLANEATDDEVRVLAANLPALETAALRLLSDRRPGPIAAYLQLRSEALGLRVTDEDAEPFRRRFNGYYGVRRNASWRRCFYEQFEAAKPRQLPPDLMFDAVLRALAAETGRVEASFVSKLVATLNPTAPVIDSVIRTWVAGRILAPPFGPATANAYFRWLANLMTRLSAT